MINNRPPLAFSARWISLGSALVVAGLTWLPGGPAQASVALTRADIEAILNRVELIPRGRSARMARSRDFMAVGDTLRTAAQSQAQLRFNDGSLARVGERATFQFLPNTRNFRLSNGTMLLLIPPGRGRSTIQTPSAITGIQGSAVVVRHIEERNLTIVMALTNNPTGPMTVTTLGCDDGSESCVSEHALYAGQMALVQGNQVQILDFDLPTFYDTSHLTDGLELNNPDPTVSLGPDLDLVREETLEALDREGGFADAIMLNPAAVAITSSDQGTASEPWLLSPAMAETQLGGRPHSLTAPVTSSVVGVSPIPANRGGAIVSGTQDSPGNAPTRQPAAPSAAVQTPTTRPPVAQPPVTQPPVAQPPVAQPPVAQPPVAQPPVVQPPVAQPPVAQPPVAQPPVAQPPVVQPPVAQPPVAQPPVAQPPVVQPPVVVEPPVTQPPGVQPPTGPEVPANPPPFRPDPTVPANPPANPPVIFDPPEKDPVAPVP
ncbi:MAG: FecR domain-containing protein [Spirulina sp.]